MPWRHFPEIIRVFLARQLLQRPISPAIDTILRRSSHPKSSDRREITLWNVPSPLTCLVGCPSGLGSTLDGLLEQWNAPICSLTGARADLNFLPPPIMTQKVILRPLHGHQSCESRFISISSPFRCFTRPSKCLYFPRSWNDSTHIKSIRPQSHKVHSHKLLQASSRSSDLLKSPIL